MMRAEIDWLASVMAELRSKKDHLEQGLDPQGR